MMLNLMFSSTQESVATNYAPGGHDRKIEEGVFLVASLIANLMAAPIS